MKTHALSVLFAALLVACTNKIDTPPDTGTERSEPPPPVKDASPSDGPVCGGFANLPCPAGQRCVIADADRNIPDATGTCQ